MSPTSPPPLRRAPIVLARASDECLVELAREGDERAFESIVERYRPQLLAHARGIAGEHAAEDALQRGAPALALEQVRLALRRSALSPGMLGLYAAALEATGRCSEAASVAQNAGSLFATDCSLRNLDTNEPLGCAEYVQSRVGSSSAPCKGAKRAAARTSAR